MLFFWDTMKNLIFQILRIFHSGKFDFRQTHFLKIQLGKTIFEKFKFNKDNNKLILYMIKSKEYIVNYNL